jgi:uncharacterized membrane protein YbaN (DUF454 family)
LIKSIWVISGTIGVGLAILGIFLPILPTTPFLLLAAFCYGRGSRRFYHWLVDRSWGGAYIRSYREGRGIKVKQKVMSIVLLWLTIGFSIATAMTPWWLNFVLGMVAIGVTIHLIKMKSRQPDSCEQVERCDFVHLVEVEMTRAIIKVEKEHLDRGPLDGRTFFITDLVLIRLKGLITPAEKNMQKLRMAKCWLRRPGCNSSKPA